MVTLLGKNKDFFANFNPSTQSYTVFYKGKMLVRNKFSYSEIKSYLN
jgi:hypothetical protein